jgi:hypothetical protein
MADIINVSAVLRVYDIITAKGAVIIRKPLRLEIMQRSGPLTEFTISARYSYNEARNFAYIMDSMPKPEREAARTAACKWQRSRHPEAIREPALDGRRIRDGICRYVFGGRRDG